MRPPEPKDEADRPLADVDRVVHEPARLTILMYLSSVESADFVFLMRVAGLTWGNLSSHLSKLEEVGYVEIEKTFLRKKPHTVIRLSKRGRRALRDYRQTMQRTLDQLGH
jgi:DNA-binding transcriptional ArsR family regulator